jgi:hypothetical protein
VIADCNARFATSCLGIIEAPFADSGGEKLGFAVMKFLAVLLLVATGDQCERAGQVASTALDWSAPQNLVHAIW